jgi:hypothetical protein
MKLVETIHFETFLQDIIHISDSALFYRVAKDEQYAPIILQEDKIKAVRKMSSLHKKWLNLTQAFGCYCIF